MVSSDERDRLVAAAGSLENDATSFLEEMVRTPSVNPPGEYDAIHQLVRSRFESFGWDTDTVWTDPEVLEDLGLPEEYPRPNLLGYVNRGDGPTIALNAHFDTVPADGWDSDPFNPVVEEGRLFGRGAADSKGRIASYTLAARALESADLIPDATVVLAITADEETGGEAGPGYLTTAGGFRPDFAIVEGYVNEVWHAAAGVIHYRVTVRGAAAHAGVSRDEGANAIDGAARILRAIGDYDDELATRESSVDGIGSPTCTPGTIEGGVKTNVVPAHCSFTVDQRVPPDFEMSELEGEFREVIESVSLPDGTSASVDVVLRARPHYAPPDAPQVRAVAENARAMLGRAIPVRGTRGFTDARFFDAVGTAVVNYGPGDDASNPHGANESIALDQVRDAGAVVAASILDIAHTATD